MIFLCFLIYLAGIGTLSFVLGLLDHHNNEYGNGLTFIIVAWPAVWVLAFLVLGIWAFNCFGKWIGSTIRGDSDEC